MSLGHKVALRAVGELPDGEIDLAGTALRLGAIDHPGVSLEGYSRHLEEVAEVSRRSTRADDSVERQVAALSSVVAGRFRYEGDAETYDDMRNANLIDVIDRRRGLPVALAILYLHAGRSYGADIAGLKFPSHFLLQITGRGQRAIVDPFNRGRLLAAEDLRNLLKRLQGAEAELEHAHFQPVGNRDILIRLQNNIKLRAIAAQDFTSATSMLERMMWIAPKRSELWWEHAIIDSRQGNLKRAVSTLERFLVERPGGQGRAEIEDLLQRLRNRCN